MRREMWFCFMFFLFNFVREIITTAVNTIRYSSVQTTLRHWKVILNPEPSTAIALGTSCVWDSFTHGWNKLGNRLGRSRNSTNCKKNCLCKNVLFLCETWSANDILLPVKCETPVLFSVKRDQEPPWLTTLILLIIEMTSKRFKTKVSFERFWRRFYDQYDYRQWKIVLDLFFAITKIERVFLLKNNNNKTKTKQNRNNNNNNNINRTKQNRTEQNRTGKREEGTGNRDLGSGNWNREWRTENGARGSGQGGHGY